MKTKYVAMFGFVVLAGCNQASFTGRTPEKAKAVAPAQPAQPTTTPTTTPSTTPVTTPTANGTPSKPGIFDKITGWFSNLPDIDVSTPNPNEVNFGSATKVFHIGDGEMSNSSCKLGVIFYPRRGANYYFEFEVLEDNSKVNVELGRVCGVDDGFSQTNHASLIKGTTYLHRQGIAAGSKSLTMPSIMLNRGVYTVLVESDQNPARKNDRDDFLIGRVKITADKKLKAGQVGARD